MAALAVAALLLLLLIKLAVTVHGGGSFAVDARLLLALRQPGNLGVPIGPAWLRLAMVDITALGGATVLTMVTIGAATSLAAAGRIRTAIFLAAAAISGSVLERVLKAGLGRERPTVVPHLVEVTTLSFPSGHAMNSAIIYLTIALILGRAVETRRLRSHLLGMAVAMVVLIGASRVYLGVHYPTDVLAGWLVGCGWATLCWRAALALQRRRTLEPPG